MAFADLAAGEPGIQLLQRSLERGRLAHAYLFAGHDLEQLELIARNLSKTVNCLHPLKPAGIAIDCCDQCIACQKIDHDNHADVFWVRPESKSRQIKIGQLTRRNDSPPRVLLDVVNLKPTESSHKIGVIVAADRMNEQAANAFLKTLEEPPANSILVLLSTEPQRLLETILSRCLRLTFGSGTPAQLAATHRPWLQRFSEMASLEQKSLIGRYRLMDVLLARLAEARAAIEESLSARSPLERHPDAEEDLRDRWEEELKAAIEAEYRRQRADILSALHWWLRDIWIQSIQQPGGSADKQLLTFPELTGSTTVAARISRSQATENLNVIEQLQRWLGTNVQETLALEVSLLKLHL